MKYIIPTLILLALVYLYKYIKVYISVLSLKKLINDVNTDSKDRKKEETNS